jgi:hypothetical protein
VGNWGANRVEGTDLSEAKSGTAEKTDMLQKESENGVPCAVSVTTVNLPISGNIL